MFKCDSLSHSVNSNMVVAYWLIGREIVEEAQEGEERAEYGKQVIDNLSVQLTQQYKSGFSVTTLQYFRKFYLVYPDRCSSIPRPLGAELKKTTKSEKTRQPGAEFVISGIQSPSCAKSPGGFNSQLSVEGITN